MKTTFRRKGGRGFSAYTNLVSKHKTRKDQRSRKRAEYLATLPKDPVKRFFYRAHPKRFFAYWFSREGGIMALKIAGVGLLLMMLMVGALFAYYRRELDAIRPGELSKRVATTVSRYVDRNGNLLWEDKGDGDYKLVVKSEGISKYMKDATIAIEDKDFYKHKGFSLSGITRAAINNFKGGGTQGGSTLTQQLVKQVFFADESQNRGLGGIPRKIKETILAIEVERMYNKDQILTLYLNESPYGGRRNGVESAAQTYFGKSAKDLTLAESALLAGIPQQPGRFDPYYAIQDPEAKKDLITRQHTVLKYMAEQNYISQKESEEAQKVSILDTLKPESETYKNIKAPHFVQMVKTQLESELGKATVGNGGLTIKTTLDVRAQDIVDGAMDSLFASNLPRTAGFDNGAATVIDIPTGQILAMRGSRDYGYPGYGYTNAAMSFIQPGSSIKPLVFAALFKQRPGENYAPGSILADENINGVLGNGADLNNFDNKFYGKLTIRSALAMSRNTTAVKAYLISGRDPTLNTIREAGNLSYCTDGQDSQASWSLAIGGCGLRQVEHVNAFATFGRMGTYKPATSILEVKNAEGQVIKKWKDEGKQAFDPQVAYMVSDILSDDGARSPVFGRGASGFNIPGVKTATKTGTSNIGNKAKDMWMMSYSSRVAMGIWVGNNVPSPMNSLSSSIVGPTVAKIMEPLHKNVLTADGTWKSGDWYTQPAGIQRLTIDGRNDIFPSWYNKNQGVAKEKMTFDRISRKKATSCTPDTTKVEIEVQKYTDPITKKTVLSAPDGYDPNADDDLHKCEDAKPFVNDISATRGSDGVYKITASVSTGTHAITTVNIKVGSTQQSLGASPSGTYEVSYTPPGSGPQQVSVDVTDAAGYTNSSSRTLNFTAGAGD